MKYRHIFFDLDNTLWDHEANSRATLEELFRDYSLGGMGIDLRRFLEIFLQVNLRYWEQYRGSKVTAEWVRMARFTDTLSALGIESAELAAGLSAEYMERCPRKPLLLPGAREMLSGLSWKYSVHIITNGFEKVQQLKIASAGLEEFLTTVMTSERAGAQKPDPVIFLKAFAEAGAGRDESIFIGDDLVADMAGAKNAGIDRIYLNPAGTEHPEEVTYEITSLKEISGIL